MLRLILFLAVIIIPAQNALAAEYLVKYKKGESPTREIKIAHKTMQGLYLLEINKEEKAKLESSKKIAYIEKNYIRYISKVPNDPFYSKQWGLENTGQEIVVGSSSFFGTPGADIAGPLAWDTRTDASSVPLAIIDSGIDLSHPDLEDNLWTNPGEIAGNGIDDDENGYIDDIHGWDFINNDNNPTDDNGHGTHVAGIAGAKGDNSLGVAGVAWEASLAALKACNANGACPDNALIEAIDYARKMNFPLSNNSYGGEGNSKAVEDVISLAQDQGHLFVAAAGNESQNNDGANYYPGNYPLDNIVSVAASRDNDSKASFSNYGKNTVDIAAPGVNILSTLPGGRYGWESGTSMSAPMVAGGAALLMAQNTDWKYEKTRSAIFASARQSSQWSSYNQSSGILDLGRAFTYSPIKPSRPQIISSPSMISREKQATFSFSGEPASSFSCRLNQGAWEKCTSPRTYFSLSPGEQLFSLRQADGWGNTSEEAQYVWTVQEEIGTLVDIEKRPKKYSNTSSAKFIFSGKESSLCSIDQSAFEPCSSPKIYKGLSDGKHSFRARASSAGEIAEFSWKVDTKPPKMIGARILSSRDGIYKIRVSAKDKTTKLKEVEFAGKDEKPATSRRPLETYPFKRRVVVEKNREPRWVRAKDRAQNWSKWIRIKPLPR